MPLPGRLFSHQARLPILVGLSRRRHAGFEDSNGSELWNGDHNSVPQQAGRRSSVSFTETADTTVLWIALVRLSHSFARIELNAGTTGARGRFYSSEIQHVIVDPMPTIATLRPMR